MAVGLFCIFCLRAHENPKPSNHITMNLQQKLARNTGSLDLTDVLRLWKMGAA